MIALQFLACFCNILACLTDNAAIDQAADLVDLIADIVWCAVCGCMQVRCPSAFLSGPGRLHIRQPQACLPTRCVRLCLVLRMSGCAALVPGMSSSVVSQARARPSCHCGLPCTLAVGWWLVWPRGSQKRFGSQPLVRCTPRWHARHAGTHATLARAPRWHARHLATAPLHADTSQDRDVREFTVDRRGASPAAVRGVPCLFPACMGRSIAATFQAAGDTPRQPRSIHGHPRIVQL